MANNVQEYNEGFVYRGRPPGSSQVPAWHLEIGRFVDIDSVGRTMLPTLVLTMEEVIAKNISLPDVLASLNIEAVADRDKALTKGQNLTEKCNLLEFELEALTLERATLTSGNEDLSKNNKMLVGERDNLLIESTNLKEKQDILLSDKDNLLKELNNIKAELDSVKSNRDSLIVKCEALSAERDIVSTKLAEVQADVISMNTITSDLIMNVGLEMLGYNEKIEDITEVAERVIKLILKNHVVLPDSPVTPAPSLIVSDRQFFQALALAGDISETEALAAVMTGTLPARIEAAVQALPNTDRFAARMLLSGATTFDRYHPMVAILGAILEKDSASLDALWASANGL